MCLHTHDRVEAETIDVGAQGLPQCSLARLTLQTALIKSVCETRLIYALTSHTPLARTIRIKPTH